jgi:2-amino-4-hydroxy-6-hydroxymethyldihydropteridine diphosphokinase
METSKPVETYIAVGSNIHPERNITEALQKLMQYVQVDAISTFYRTKALDRPEQGDFLNGVLRVWTTKPVRDLKFGVLRKIEEELQRVRTEDKYADRTIDLDIALYGELIINESDLVIPDPDIRERPFIVMPLLELSPNLILPDTGEPLSSLSFAEVDSGLEPALSFTDSLKKYGGFYEYREGV